MMETDETTTIFCITYNKPNRACFDSIEKLKETHIIFPWFENQN